MFVIKEKKNLIKIRIIAIREGKQLSNCTKVIIYH